jgi:hypothetical protein
MAHRSRTISDPGAAIFGRAGLRLEPVEVRTICYRGTVAADKIPRRFDAFPLSSGEISMVITSAHIPAIVALIAGILILIMPRLLNFVVAIYLICIGLIGLGVLKMFQM